MPVQATGTRPLRRDAQANRERILEAARALFATEGIDAPVEEIAHRAGVGMGTLYRRFATKEDLIDAVLEDSFDSFIAAAEQALAENDPWIGFAGFCERSLELHAANRGLKDVYATRRHGRHAEQKLERTRPLIRRLIERAQAQGTLRADFVPEDLPLVFWAAGRVIEASSEVAPELWRRHLGMLLDGLRADAATPLAQPPLTRAQLARVRERKQA
jgi:AcrR family transcriptional regulator